MDDEEKGPEPELPFYFNEPWVSSPEKLTERLEAVEQLEDYIERRYPTGREYARLRDALQTIRDSLEGDLKEAEALKLHEAGIQLDPDAAGGGRVRTGKRGRPRSILSEEVRRVLRERYVAWDGAFPFPGENTQALRDWLHEELKGRFSPHEIDPSSGGPLWVIIKNVQRLR